MKQYKEENGNIHIIYSEEEYKKMMDYQEIAKELIDFTRGLKDGSVTIPLQDVKPRLAMQDDGTYLFSLE